MFWHSFHRLHKQPLASKKGQTAEPEGPHSERLDRYRASRVCSENKVLREEHESATMDGLWSLDTTLCTFLNNNLTAKKSLLKTWRQLKGEVWQQTAIRERCGNYKIELCREENTLPVFTAKVTRLDWQQPETQAVHIKHVEFKCQQPPDMMRFPLSYKTKNIFIPLVNVRIFPSSDSTDVICSPGWSTGCFHTSGWRNER